MIRNRAHLFSLFAFFILFSLSNVQAQQSSVDIDTEKLQQQREALKGTFQIEMIGTRALPTFNISLYDTIEELRKEDEVVYHDVSDIMRIKILPRSVIESDNFEPVERVTHISSK